MQNKFCFLKGIVDCDSGMIQDCNNKRTVSCRLEQKKAEEKKKNGTKEKTAEETLPEIAKDKRRLHESIKGKSKERTREKTESKQNWQGFCFIKGMVSCNPGRIQDCNIKRVAVCPKD